jgi:N-acyl-D-amino-acid deacylase
MFPPAMSADRRELLALGRAVARHDRLFAAHFRNYSDRLLEGVDEILDVARQTGCRLQISHLAVAGRRNWGRVPQALERIDAARSDGLDVAADIYPYVAGSANLSQLLPEWAQAGGAPAIVERLGRDTDRARIMRDWETQLFFGWDEIEVASEEPGLEETLGLTVEAVGALWGMEPGLAALDLIQRSDNRVVMVAYGRSEDDLRAVLQHEATSIGSDGLAMTPDGPSGAGRPHPRNYGCYPRFLGRYVRDGGLVPLEQAIAMCTSRPADRIGLIDRGRIAQGAVADLVIFDPATVVDTATFRDPGRYPVGIRDVIVSGVPVVRGGVQRDARPGRVLLA